ncbi:MAG: sulfate ABC transporter permease subunit CysT [Lautropia sp.]|nr:sulfate ABC transporter permease subunit CysT [Lautropia sp.]
MSRLRFFESRPILPGFGLSFGISVLYLHLVILIPLAALLFHAADMGWAQYWAAISDPRVVASYRVTLGGALISTVVVTLIGLLLAWVLTRYEFPGRRLLDSLIDLPFALPTAVAGLTLATLLAPGGWIGQLFAPWGIKIAYAYPGLVIAMIFTSIPFIVRTVQPVLEDLGHEVEEAAGTLGASPRQIFLRVILPALVPALLAGASQAFIRSLGEFGAVVMIAGNIPFQTEITSLMIFVRLQEFDYAAAAAIASVVLITSLTLLFGLQLLQSHLMRWQRSR